MSVFVCVPGAEHILMEGTLTALALSPQAGEALLQSVQVEDLEFPTAGFESWTQIHSNATCVKTISPEITFTK